MAEYEPLAVAEVSLEGAAETDLDHSYVVADDMGSTDPGETVRTGRVVHQEGGISHGGFVPDGSGGESLALHVGENNGRLVLYDAQTLEPTGVVANAVDGEWMGAFDVSPDERQVCCCIGLDHRSRVAMYQIEQGVAWRERWSHSSGGPLYIDARFSPDSSVIACVMLGEDKVIFHDAETGAPTGSTCVTFGVCKNVVPLANCFNTLRFTRDFMVVSGGYETKDARTVGVWPLVNIGGEKKRLVETDVVEDDEPAVLSYNCDVGPIATCEKYCELQHKWHLFPG